MRTLKLISLLSVLLFVTFANADFSLNWKGYDTCNVTKFAFDTFRVCKVMNFTNAENKLLVYVFDDTANAGRNNDSVVCEIGYQLGAPVITLTGLQDTAWTNCIVLDTINTLTASKRYSPLKYGGAESWALDRSVETSIRPVGQVDTTIGTTSGAAFIPIAFPFWAPYVRFYVHGLTGNSHTFIRAKMVFEQRQWINVRNQ
jgi:hypothetical protein